MMEGPRSGRPAAAWRFALLSLTLVSTGCGFLHSPKREFARHGDVLQAVARASGYSPDGSRYRLIHADVGSDFVTFHFQGVAHPGDWAWVTRFAQKNTEQKPEDLVKLESLLETISKEKEGFRAERAEWRALDGLEVEFASYRYLSPLIQGTGRKAEAGGVAAITRLERDPAPVVYHLNVFNMEGDRPHLGWEELEPLLRAITRET